MTILPLKQYYNNRLFPALFIVRIFIVLNKR